MIVNICTTCNDQIELLYIMGRSYLSKSHKLFYWMNLSIINSYPTKLNVGS